MTLVINYFWKTVYLSPPLENFLGGAPTSLCHFFRPSVYSSVHRALYPRKCTSFDRNFWYPYMKWWYLQVFIYMCHIPYLRNSIAYDHDFWYTCLKWGISMHFFHFFKILVFWVVSGVKGKKWPKMTKNYDCHASYLRKHTSYDCHLWYTGVKW